MKYRLEKRNERKKKRVKEIKNRFKVNTLSLHVSFTSFNLF